MPNINTKDLSGVGFIRNRLGALADTLRRLNQDGTINTQEGLVSEAHRVLSQFFGGLQAPLLALDVQKKVVNTLPKYYLRNKELDALDIDLSLLFQELEGIEGIALANFNLMLPELGRLKRRLFSASSRVADLSLYTDNATTDAIFFSDTFSNLSKIDSGSSLLAAEQCEIDFVQGMATLPIDRGARNAIVITEIPAIGAESNGVPGNNQEIGAQPHNDINVILDNDPDTWFEYERVVNPAVDDGRPLVLDLEVILGQPQIINLIRVNPNNFGTRTQVEIDRIDTSEDGTDYVSIKDDIPIPGFFTRDEENIFRLAPSISSAPGQGIYSFTPRKLKFLRLVFKQRTPYVINTASGEKYRYVIGIKDIVLEALPYKATGEFISTLHTADEEIKKVILLTSQKPDIESPGAVLSHFLSTDNGGSWNEIRPKGFMGPSGLISSVPEVLNLNVPGEANSLTTTNPVTTLRYKAVLKRDDAALSSQQAPTLLTRTRRVSELLEAPASSSSPLRLRHQPIVGSVQVLDIRAGSRDKRNVTLKLKPASNQQVNRLSLTLPFRDLKRTRTKSPVTGVLSVDTPLRVYVNGVETQEGLLGTVDIPPRYRENLENGTLDFGAGIQASEVTVALKEEHLFVDTAQGTPNKARLQFPAVDDKKDFELYALGPVRSATQVLKKGVTRNKLKPNIVHRTRQVLGADVGLPPLSFSGSATRDFKSFINGREEFLEGEGTPASRYSVDEENGILHTAAPTSTSEDTTVTYFYHPRRRLEDHEWEFSYDSRGIVDGVVIKPGFLQTYSSMSSLVGAETVPTGQRRFELRNMNIVVGSVLFSPAPAATGNTLFREVAFIDGHSEFSSVVETAQTVSVALGVGSTTFPLVPPITTDLTREIVFSNQTLFANRGVVAPVVNGQYLVNRETSQVTIFLTSAAPLGQAGTVRYFFDGPPAGGATSNTRYSVDYQEGVVYTEASTPAGISVSYMYANYVARYNIARLVDPADIEVDATRQTIQLASRELLGSRHMTTFGQDSEGHGARSYLVSYQGVMGSSADISELAPFLTPALRDYTLKVITKSRMTL